MRGVSVTLPQFDERSLEDLCIAISNLKLLDGRLVNIIPEHVLNEELLKQIPDFTRIFKERGLSRIKGILE